jgi:hypothetical protein
MAAEPRLDLQRDGALGDGQARNSVHESPGSKKRQMLTPHLKNPGQGPQDCAKKSGKGAATGFSGLSIGLDMAAAGASQGGRA